MSLVSFAYSRWGPTAGISLARLLPPKVACRFAAWIADRVAGQTGTPLVEALRTNQAVVRGLPREDPELDQAVQAVLRNTTRSYLELFQLMRKGHAGLSQSGELDAELVSAGRKYLEAGRGLLYTGCHTMGLDLMILLIGGLGYPIQGLAYPETEASYVVTNQIRRSFGLDLTPTDFRSLRRAMRHLRGRGMVATAIDRPDPRGEMLEFCGLPARLPIGHARLALRAAAPIMAGGTFLDPTGRYRAVLLDVLETDPFQDKPNGELELAQEVIRIHERFIRQRPDQWLMFHPVWPEQAQVQSLQA